MSGRAVVAGGVAVAAFASIQVTGPARTTPPIDPGARLEANARVPHEAANVLRRACYDCHSNETRWPWYSRVAPVSWLVVRDVEEGRGRLNFSHWADYNVYDRADLLDEACRLATSRDMPRMPYPLMHSEARLTEADIAALCRWTTEEARRLTGGP